RARCRTRRRRTGPHPVRARRRRDHRPSHHGRTPTQHQGEPPGMTTVHDDTEILIVGAGLGGVAAALAAARQGARVVLTEEFDWIGGQSTSQAVPPDEHPWIEDFGCTRSYRAFRDGIRDYYRRAYPLTDAARARTDLNPGAGWVSKLCHEPQVALAVLEEKNGSAPVCTPVTFRTRMTSS